MGTDNARFGWWECACIKRNCKGRGAGMLIDEIDGSIPVFRELKQGELVHVQGVPLRLVTDVLVQSTEGNWNLIEEFRAEEAEADKLPRGADQNQATPRESTKSPICDCGHTKVTRNSACPVHGDAASPCNSACGPAVSTWHVATCPNAPEWLSRFQLGDRVFSGRHEGRVTAIAEGGWVRVKRRVLTIWYREADLHRLLAESRGEGLYFYPERTNAND